MSKIQRLSPNSDEGDQGFHLLPEDLIVSEILVRLAPKALFRFKCVSKRYNSIISDPKWGHSYVQRARLRSSRWSSFLYPFTNQKNLETTRIGPFYGKEKRLGSIRIRAISLPSLRDHETPHKILGSSNGLILSLFHPPSQSQSQSQSQEEKRFGLCVSNPLTKQSVELPELNDALQIDYSRNFVFGFVAKRVEQATTALTYKVVLIRRVPWKDIVDNATKTSTYIFSSDTGSWATREQVPCPRDIAFTDEACLSHKATLHCVLFCRSEAVITYDPFDNPGQFGRIPLPSNKTRLHGLYLPDGSRSWTGAQGMVYSGEQRGLGFVQFTRQNPDLPCSHTRKMWRLSRSNKSSWRTLPPAKCEIPSMPYLCERLLIAPNSFANSDLLCHPYVLDNKLTVFYSEPGRDPPITRRVVDVVLETPEGFGEGGYRNPLIHIDFCPWASPSFHINKPI